VKTSKKIFLGITIIMGIFIVYIGLMFVFLGGLSDIYYANNTLHLEKHTTISFTGENGKGYINKIDLNLPTYYRDFYLEYGYDINMINNIQTKMEEPRNFSNGDVINITITTDDYRVNDGQVKVVDTFDVKVSSLK